MEMDARRAILTDQENSLRERQIFLDRRESDTRPVALPLHTNQDDAQANRRQHTQQTEAPSHRRSIRKFVESCCEEDDSNKGDRSTIVVPPKTMSTSQEQCLLEQGGVWEFGDVNLDNMPEYGDGEPCRLQSASSRLERADDEKEEDEKYGMETEKTQERVSHEHEDNAMEQPTRSFRYLLYCILPGSISLLVL